MYSSHIRTSKPELGAGSGGASGGGGRWWEEGMCDYTFRAPNDSKKK